MSASACAEARSVAVIGPGEPRNRLRAPSVRSRSRRGERVDGAEARAEGHRREARPARLLARHVRGRHLRAGEEAVEAGTLGVLDLEQLDHLRRLGRRGHQPQGAARVGEQYAGRRRVEQLHAALRDAHQQLDDVEVVDQVVGQLDEGASEPLLAGHVAGRSSWVESAVRQP